MDLKHVFVFVIHFMSTFTRHEKGFAKTLWQDRCARHDKILNDCNWCWCDKNHRFQCKARVCSEVDMFGHFNDAVQELHVEMEGHGAWRSRQPPCSAGVYYRRGDILCVCNDYGDWPNPVCRDLFRVLYSVQPTGLTNITNNQSCTPTKLYLIGCNVCFCPYSGMIDENMCTNQTCQDDDPALLAAKLGSPADSKETKDDAQEIYASCEPKFKYLLGCKECTCLRNNRLLCGECSTPNFQNELKSYCQNNKPGNTFNIECNLCQCDEALNMYCTAKKCLKDHTLNSMKQNDRFRIHKSSCTAGIQNNSDCNTCRCVKENNEMLLDCTANVCGNYLNDCVENTTYELNCMICHCHKMLGEKRETCRNNPVCSSDYAVREKRSKDVNSLHGYCEPLHTYNMGCNNCTCLKDGKTLKCTSLICKDHLEEPVTVNVIPLKVEDGGMCLKGRSYKIKCNICFCLRNGNSLCTTNDCSKTSNNKLI